MEKENLGGCLMPDWQAKLVEERAELLKKTLALKNTLDDKKNLKLSNREWEMLRSQFCVMREYVQILTDRCVYYGLIEAGDLNLHY